MNIIQKKQAIKRFLEGESIENITRDMGITEEQLRAAIKAGLDLCKGTTTKYERMVFPGIAKFLRESGISIRRLASECNIDLSNLHKVLHGVHEPTLRTIYKILDTTGMTFEEAFARKEEPDAHT